MRKMFIGFLASFLSISFAISVQAKSPKEIVYNGFNDAYTKIDDVISNSYQGIDINKLYEEMLSKGYTTDIELKSNDFDKILSGLNAVNLNCSFDTDEKKMSFIIKGLFDNKNKDLEANFVIDDGKFYIGAPKVLGYNVITYSDAELKKNINDYFNYIKSYSSPNIIQNLKLDSALNNIKNKSKVIEVKSSNNVINALKNKGINTKAFKTYKVVMNGSSIANLFDILSQTYSYGNLTDKDKLDLKSINNKSFKFFAFMSDGKLIGFSPKNDSSDGIVVVNSKKYGVEGYFLHNGNEDVRFNIVNKNNISEISLKGDAQTGAFSFKYIFDNIDNSLKMILDINNIAALNFDGKYLDMSDRGYTLKINSYNIKVGSLLASGSPFNSINLSGVIRFNIMNDKIKKPIGRYVSQDSKEGKKIIDEAGKKLTQIYMPSYVDNSKKNLVNKK